MRAFLISLDQLLNTLAGPLVNWLHYREFNGPWGHPDETISSVLGKYRYAGILARYPGSALLYRWLNHLEPDHCERSIEWAVGWSPYAIQIRSR